MLKLVAHCFETELQGLEAVPQVTGLNILFLTVLRQLDMKKQLLGILIELMRRGYVIPVLSLIYKWCQGLVMKDQALIRLFVTSVFSSFLAASECLACGSHLCSLLCYLCELDCSDTCTAKPFNGSFCSTNEG